MRTAIFLVAMVLVDVATTLGRIYPPEAKEHWAFILVVFIIMDLVDFVRGKHG